MQFHIQMQMITDKDTVSRLYMFNILLWIIAVKLYSWLIFYDRDSTLVSDSYMYLLECYSSCFCFFSSAELKAHR